MTVTVPATDFYGAQLQANVAALQAQVTANTATAAVQAELVTQLDAAQQLLVRYLIGNAANQTPGTGNAGNKPSFMTASHILSSQTINT